MRTFYPMQCCDLPCLRVAHCVLLFQPAAATASPSAEPSLSAQLTPITVSELTRIYHWSSLLSGLPKPAAPAAWLPLPKDSHCFPQPRVSSHTLLEQDSPEPVELQGCEPEACERHLLLVCCPCCHNSPQPLNQGRAPAVLGAVQRAILAAPGLQTRLLCFVPGEEPPGQLQCWGRAWRGQIPVRASPASPLPLPCSLHPSSRVPSTGCRPCQPSWCLGTALGGTAKDPAPDLPFTSATATGGNSPGLGFPRGTAASSVLLLSTLPTLKTSLSHAVVPMETGPKSSG